MSNKDLLDHDHIQAQIANLMADTANINQRTEWYVITLLIMGAGAFAAAFMAIGKYLF